MNQTAFELFIFGMGLGIGFLLHAALVTWEWRKAEKDKWAPKNRRRADFLRVAPK